MDISHGQALKMYGDNCGALCRLENICSLPLYT